MTTITKRLNQVYVYPDFEGKQNVIKKVVFSIDFKREDCVSTAIVEAILDTTNLQEFVEIDLLTDDQIIQWAFEKEGGDALLQNIQPHHEAHLDYLVLSSGTVEYVRVP